LLWSDDCADVAGSMVAITNDSRSDLIAPLDTTRVNLSKNVGTEPNYTTTGVVYPDDTDWKQWYKSDGNTNLMTDAPACSDSSTCYTFTTYPTVEHITHGILVKTSGYYKDSSNFYLSEYRDFWEDSIVNIGTYNSVTGLYYRYLLSVRGSSASNLCNNIAWSLIDLADTSENITGGIPSKDPIRWAWTTTTSGSLIMVWRGASSTWSTDSNNHDAVCVR